MKREGGIGGPLLYLTIYGSIAGIVGVGYQLIMQQALQSTTTQSGTPNPFQSGMPVAGWIAVAVAMPLLIVIGSFVTAGVAHLSLMICGGAKQPFETTFRTYCYSQGSVAPLQLVPICGAYIAGIWGLVCAIIGLSKAHEIGAGRAALAVFLPLLLCCGLAVGTAFVFGLTAAMAAKGGN